MRFRRSIAHITVFASVAAAVAQTGPSVPISEMRLKAGTSFTVTPPLGKISSQAFSVRVTYRTITGRPIGNFDCSGDLGINQKEIQFSCITAKTTPLGDYRADESTLTAVRVDIGKPYKLSLAPFKFPIVTILPPDPPPPIPETVLPEISGDAQLTPDLQASFFDASSRAQDILDDLTKHFSAGAKDTKAGRAYLQSQIHGARNIIALTRKRVAVAPNGLPGSKSPELFEDFDRRLEMVEKELAVHHETAWRDDDRPRLFVLASEEQDQRPQSSESILVDAGRAPAANDLQKSLGNLVIILIDMAEGFSEISQDGSTDFVWSLTTTPPGAQLWYRRLGEEEIQWTGLSDFKDQHLVKARWTFRVSWGGCSKETEVNPWLQSSINMEESKKGCKADGGK